jgi:peptidoglycan/LPS O-acetylase OafA/YrhL
MASRPQLRALTGIRFFAAFNVLLFHLWNGKNIEPHNWVATGIISSGFVGVSFFFLLSGFILAYAYDRKRVSNLGLRNFWTARFARIYPVYVLSLATSAAWFFTFPLGPKLIPALKVITMTQAITPTDAMAWNYPAWTMTTEVCFYLLFPFVAPLIARLSTRGLIRFAVVFWLVQIAFPISYMAIAPDHIHHATSSYGAFWLNLMKFNPVPHIPEFLVGLALGYRFAAATPNPRRGDLLAAAGLALSLGMLAFSVHIPYVLMHSGLMIPPFSLLMYGLAEGRVLSRIFGIGLLYLPGEASYSLYILQVPVWLWLEKYGVMHTAHYVIVYLTVCVAVSLVALKLVEETARDAIRVWLSPSHKTISSVVQTAPEKN